MRPEMQDLQSLLNVHFISHPPAGAGHTLPAPAVVDVKPAAVGVIIGR
jgi:hypothetical protein